MRDFISLMICMTTCHITNPMSTDGRNLRATIGREGGQRSGRSHADLRDQDWLGSTSMYRSTWRLHTRTRAKMKSGQSTSSATLRRHSRVSLSTSAPKPAPSYGSMDGRCLQQACIRSS